MMNPNLPVNGVVIYARSATGEDEALNKQINTCRAWAKSYDYPVFQICAEVTGGNDACPELERAIQAAQEQGAALLCARLDRLGRSVPLLIARMNDCEKRGVPILFADTAEQEDAAGRIASRLAVGPKVKWPPNPRIWAIVGHGWNLN